MNLVTILGLVFQLIAQLCTAVGTYLLAQRSVNGGKYELLGGILLSVGPVFAGLVTWVMHNSKPPTTGEGVGMKVTNPPALVGWFLVSLLSVLFFAALGCASKPVEAAAEVRALYKEAQTQVDIACRQEKANHERCQEFNKKLAEIGPFIDSLEIAAAVAESDPGQYINFQALWVEYKPKVESLLISIVLRRYLGV